jgi:hypothetical protein
MLLDQALKRSYGPAYPQHRGLLKTGGGNQRGSIFRKIVGAALINRDQLDYPTWSIKKGNRAMREAEVDLERKVSEFIRQMHFLWLAVEDEPGPNSQRDYVERNAIALLSNYNKPPLDLPSNDWLGHYSDRERVRNSGLWNQDHVDGPYDPTFIDVLNRLVSEMRKPA